MISTQHIRVLKNQMDEKLTKLLTCVVEEVIKTGEPVGSQGLVDAHIFNVSSATIRNWFSVLENDGYIMQPHTSGGRLPTEKGYQYYVSSLMLPRILPKKQYAILEQLVGEHVDPERRLKVLMKNVAEGVQVAAILGLNDADTFYTGLSQLFSQSEFRDWKRVVGLGEILDQLDQVLARIRLKKFHEPTVLLGSQCPFGAMCGTVLLTLQDGGLAGIVGPMRMDYQSAISYLQAIKELT